MTYRKYNEEIETAKNNSIKGENYKKCTSKTIGKNIPNPNIITTLNNTNQKTGAAREIRQKVGRNSFNPCKTDIAERKYYSLH